jgi:hypothetical protein
MVTSLFFKMGSSNYMFGYERWVHLYFLYGKRDLKVWDGYHFLQMLVAVMSEHTCHL